MKTETPKKPAAQPAARWNSRALWIAGVPAFVVLTSFVGRSALDRSATASRDPRAFAPLR
jgi:hypothetical protein